MNTTAFIIARQMDRYDALSIATLPSARALRLDGSAPITSAELYEACRALTYVCECCGHNLPVDEYDRDSVGCDLCTYCYETGGLENSLSDGNMSDEEYGAAVVSLETARSALLETEAQRNRDSVVSKAIAHHAA